MGEVIDLIEAVKDDVRICATDAIANGEIARHAKIHSQFVQEQSAGFNECQTAITIGTAAAEDQLAVVLLFQTRWPLEYAAEVEHRIRVYADTRSATKSDITAPKIARAAAEQGSWVRGRTVESQSLAGHTDTAEQGNPAWVIDSCSCGHRAQGGIIAEEEDSIVDDCCAGVGVGSIEFQVAGSVLRNCSRTADCRIYEEINSRAE